MKVGSCGIFPLIGVSFRRAPSSESDENLHGCSWHLQTLLKCGISVRNIQYAETICVFFVFFRQVWKKKEQPNLQRWEKKTGTRKIQSSERALFEYSVPFHSFLKFLFYSWPSLFITSARRARGHVKVAFREEKQSGCWWDEGEEKEQWRRRRRRKRRRRIKTWRKGRRCRRAGAKLVQKHRKSRWYLGLSLVLQHTHTHTHACF